MTETGGGMTGTGAEGGVLSSFEISNRAMIDRAWSLTPSGFVGRARHCPKRRRFNGAPCGPVAQPGQSIGLLIRVSWVRIPAGLPLPLHAKRACGDAPASYWPNTKSLG